MSQFVEVNNFVQTLINKNFSTTEYDCELACDQIEWNIEMIVGVKNKEEFDKLKIKFIPYTFSCIEINNEYYELKNRTKDMFDNDKYCIKRDIIICKKLKKMKNMKSCVVVYCRVMNRLFRENYDKICLEYIKCLIDKLNSIDNSGFNL